MEINFLELSEKELITLADEIENNDPKSLFDVEYADGILNINVFASDQVYVINKHSASQKSGFLHRFLVPIIFLITIKNG